MSQIDPRQLLKVSDVCTELKMSRGSVYELLRVGDLRSITIGRSRRIPAECVTEFIATRLAAVTTPFDAA